MSRLPNRCLPASLFLLLLTFFGSVLQAAQPASAQARPATTAPTRPATYTPATTQGMGEYGRDVIMLDELVESYEAVPFAHRRHAEMAEMWDGCETCHHHTPTTAPALAQGSAAKSRHSQDDASAIPACKSCHPVAPSKSEIEMPSLKGAYHRQCLNCHRDWMGANACVICHASREGAAASMPTTRPPSADDIVGRMHKPLTPPIDKKIVARYTPVDGTEVLFRHEEHVKEFGIKCVACHRRDACADCHKSNPTTAAAGTTVPSRILKPSQTWRQSHEPCVSCHEQDRCDHCHYQPGQEPPPPFRHETTGQALDKDHVKLACGECHQHYKASPALTCSGSACHKRATVAFPTDRPGPFTPPVTTTQPTTPASADTATTQPTTRPMIIRIRRGVQP